LREESLAFTGWSGARYHGAAAVLEAALRTKRQVKEERHDK
jgi:hypothetical protein